LKNSIIKYLLILGFFFFLIACSVKKDRFVNRNFHAVATEYNVLYNGNLALEEGVAGLMQNYTDNFWEILPVERIQVVEENKDASEAKNPNFKRAEEKAVKAIQKHAMNIGGSEKNPQMDEAYLLLAKARYYENRFIPSLEALNYILYKYPQSNKIYHAKVWREKVNIRLDNDDVAIKNLKKLLQNNQINGQDLADANAMLTQAYINIGANDSAIATIKIAKEATKSSEERARYKFILGQLYESLHYKDSAIFAFQEVIEMKRKSPRKYIIQAHAKQAFQLDIIKEDTLVFLDKFNKLIKDPENQEFLDVLYHQKGIFYDKRNRLDEAQRQYNKSIKATSKDIYLLASNYRNIGEISFKKAEYKKAAMYYDSTLVHLNERTREHRQIKKKRTNLNEVILYEDTVKTNDSILSIVSMSEKERIDFFEKYIEKLKKEAEEKAKIIPQVGQNNVVVQSPANPNKGKNNFTNKLNQLDKENSAKLDISGSTKEGKSMFYFYNPVTVNFGKKEFQAKWGDRAYKENWRLAKSRFNDVIPENSDEIEEDENKPKIIENPMYDVSFYLSKIPNETREIDSLIKTRNFAYYQLGLIYKEKFKEYELAAVKLEQLLKYAPEERLILPAKYNLFKIYESINPQKAINYKNQIITQYPESRYAQTIQNTSSFQATNENPEEMYGKLYKKFQANLIREVYEEINQKIEVYFDDPIVSKLEMLRASIIGRLKGVDEYKKELNIIALTYPNEAEGKEAEMLLNTNIPLIEALDFNATESLSWKLIFPKDFAKNENKDVLLEKLNLYLKNQKNPALKLSIDLYTLDKDFIVLHGFYSKESALSALTLLTEYKDYKIKDEVFCINAEDYKIVQVKKQFEQWKLMNKN